MKEVTKHKQLFVLIDTLNDNGELLLSFANNHDLALVKTFLADLKAAYHILSTDEAKNISTTS